MGEELSQAILKYQRTWESEMPTAACGMAVHDLPHKHRESWQRKLGVISGHMFRASPWIPYDPTHRHPLPHSHDGAAPVEPTSSPQEHHHVTIRDMDAPEISTLREEEEESPPPETGVFSSKFRVNMRGPSWGQGAASGSATGLPVGPQAAGRRGPSPTDSDEEDEEDQLIDDDELAIVTETGRGPATSASVSVLGNSALQGSPRKRGAIVKAQGPRRALTGRRGRPGREPPDAAAMMSTFEVTKAEQPAETPSQVNPPAPVMVPNPSPPVPGPSTASDWTTSTPPKPPRKKPGPKKGTTLGPRGPRKNSTK